MLIPEGVVVAARVETVVPGEVERPRYFNVVEIAWAFAPVEQTAPVPHVPVEVSVPNAEYPKYAFDEVATHVIGTPTLKSVIVAVADCCIAGFVEALRARVYPNALFVFTFQVVVATAVF